MSSVQECVSDGGRDRRAGVARKITAASTGGFEWGRFTVNASLTSVQTGA